MKNKDFELLMNAVKGKSLSEIQGEEVKQVLRELLTGEFSGIKETKFKIMLKQPKGGGEASVNVVDGTVFLWINPNNWERNPPLSEGALKAVLKHELLHVESGKFSSDGSLLDDHDPKFKAMARARKIDVWNV